MLYVTTRNNRDAFTSQRALRENRGPDGGLFLPLKAPRFSQEELEELRNLPFGRCMAQVLNHLFSTNLSGWDIDFCVGRHPVRLVPLVQRTIMAECWHNPESNYSRMEKNLSSNLCNGDPVPGNWLTIAMRIAVLFGIFGELHRQGVEIADVCMVSGDFSGPISAWYARQWGLPIGNIICCCNENKNLWDLICHGQMRTDTLSVETMIPEADVIVPTDLERLIYACGGVEETQRYVQACRQGRTYSVTDGMLSALRQGLYVSVVSSSRLETVIPSVYATHGYLMTPGTALAYAGLQDYRAKTGQMRQVVILSDKSPLWESDVVARTLGITAEELKKGLL